MLIHTHSQLRHPSIVEPHLCLLECRMYQNNRHTWLAFFIHERTFILDDVRVYERRGRSEKKIEIIEQETVQGKFIQKQHQHKYTHGYRFFFVFIVCVCVSIESLIETKKNQRKNNRKLDLHECYFRLYTLRKRCIEEKVGK